MRRFDYDGEDYGRGADLRLLVDGSEVARGRLERSVPGFFSIDETFDVGTDTGSPAVHYSSGENRPGSHGRGFFRT